MNILFDIAHPADVHLFRHVRGKLINRGHKIVFLARDKDVVRELLDGYAIPYEKGTRAQKGFFGLFFELLKWFFIAYKLISKEKIDLAVSLSSPATAWAAKLHGVPHIMFNDTESGVAQLRLARPASRKIYTPNCLLADWGPKQVRYNGIHDLAYLRPEYFIPELPALGAQRSDKENKSTNHQTTKSPESDYAIIRFVSWDAVHDWGQDKTGSDFQRKVCDLISEKMQVYISAEGELPTDLEQYRLKLSPCLLHNAMAHAQLVVGDGATTATEAAVMGIPSVYISPFADSLGYCRLLKEYGLLDSFTEKEKGLNKIKELIENPDFAGRKERRQRLLKETIDVTDFITNVIDDFGRTVER